MPGPVPKGYIGLGMPAWLQELMAQPSALSQMQALNEMQRARIGRGEGPPQSGSPEAEARFNMAGNFDFTGPVGGLGATIRAYHGSPHTFDRFDMSKIGTGEGAQSYGRGLYMAEAPEVAEQYAKALGRTRAERLLDQEGGDFDRAIKEAARTANTGEGRMHPETVELLEKAKAGGGFPSRGSTYTVNLDVNHDDLLDWDLPLAKQPEKVRKAFGVNAEAQERIAALEAERKALHPADLERDRALTEELRELRKTAGPYPGIRGSELYGAIGDPVEATAKLRELGIPGIRYLDQGSRAGGEGTRNFVLFDDALAQILERK